MKGLIIGLLWMLFSAVIMFNDSEGTEKIIRFWGCMVIANVWFAQKN